MRDAEVAVLGVAARRLAAGPLHDPATGRFAGLVGYGRRASGQALQPIPAAHWEAGEVDWAKWRLRVERVEWKEVRVLELLLLTETQAAAVVDDLLPRSTHGVKARDDEVLAVLGPLVRDLAPGDPKLSREALFLAAKDDLGKLGKAVAREQIDYFMSNHMPAGKRRPRGRPKRNSPKK